MCIKVNPLQCEAAIHIAYTFKYILVTQLLRVQSKHDNSTMYCDENNIDLCKYVAYVMHSVLVEQRQLMEPLLSCKQYP